MPIRTFTVAELAALGVPPTTASHVEHSDNLLADEYVAPLKHTVLRRAIFRTRDGDRTYAVAYQVDDYLPGHHGWFSDTVEAVEVEQQPAAVLQWTPVADPPAPAPRRRLTKDERDAAWHAIEGTAAEEGADPDTVLNAVLAALDIDPPAAI